MRGGGAVPPGQARRGARDLRRAVARSRRRPRARGWTRAEWLARCDFHDAMKLAVVLNPNALGVRRDAGPGRSACARRRRRGRGRGHAHAGRARRGGPPLRRRRRRAGGGLRRRRHQPVDADGAGARLRARSAARASPSCAAAPSTPSPATSASAGGPTRSWRASSPPRAPAACADGRRRISIEVDGHYRLPLRVAHGRALPRGLLRRAAPGPGLGGAARPRARWCRRWCRGRIARWLFAPAEVDAHRRRRRRCRPKRYRLLVASMVPDVGMGFRVPGRRGARRAASTSSPAAVDHDVDGAAAAPGLRRAAARRRAAPRSAGGARAHPLRRAAELHARWRSLSRQRGGARHRTASADRASSDRMPRVRLLHYRAVCSSASAARADAAPSPTELSYASTAVGFVVGDKPFAFVGANLDVMHGADERARAAETIAAARADGLTVGRVWALGEGDAASPPWARHQRCGASGPTAGSTAARASSTACSPRRARAGCASSSRSPTTGTTSAASASTWRGRTCRPTASTRAIASSATSGRAPPIARTCRRCVDRINSITGVRYADDPTIFAWELMNESQVATPAGATARRSWIDEMASFIKARDRNHLVTPGVMGYTSRAERAEWLAVCRLPTVDYCDSHLYPETTDRVASRARLEAYIDDRVQLARYVAHKPIVFGEFGFHTDAPGYLDDAARRLVRDLPGARDAPTAPPARWPGSTSRGSATRATSASTSTAPTPTTCARRCGAGRRSRRRRRAPTNPLLGDAHGDALLYDPVRHRGRARRISASSTATSRSRRARSPRGAGSGSARWGAGADAHAYGAGDGWFDYAFTLGRGGDADAGGAAVVGVAGQQRAGRRRTPTWPCSSTACAWRRSASCPTTAPAARRRWRSARLKQGRHTLRLLVAPGAARARPVRLRRRQLAATRGHGGEAGYSAPPDDSAVGAAAGSVTAAAVRQVPGWWQQQLTDSKVTVSPYMSFIDVGSTAVPSLTSLDSSPAGPL